jgi:drug/metabolite transporter (DMT)-like permease
MQSRGVAYMAASALAFSAMAVQVKLASPRIPTGELVLARALVTLVLSYAMVRRAGLVPWGTRGRRRWLVLRGVVGFTALGCYYLALGRLPLADATTLQTTSPLFTAVLAWWLLRERVGGTTALAIACGIGGVTLIVHPGVPFASGGDPTGDAIALFSALMSACAYVLVRRLSRTEPPLVIVFYFAFVATPLAIPWAAAHFVWPRPTDWLLLAGIGAATQLGQVFLTLGLSVERAGRATSVGYLQVCFAMIWQFVVFDRAPALGTIGGAALIIAGTLAVSATGRATPAGADSRARARTASPPGSR